ncbi:MAG: four helix bundle protein [Candidatus Margulisiibacteriota bacterium]
MIILCIVLKELKETIYWLRLIDKADEIKVEYPIEDIIQETKELINIIAKSVITSKKKKKK